MRHPPRRFLLASGFSALPPSHARGGSSSLFTARSRGASINPLSDGERGPRGGPLPPPRLRPPRLVALGARAVSRPRPSGSGRAEGRRCLARAPQAGAGGGARLSDAEGGEEEQARSGGPGGLEVRGRLRAGGRPSLPGSSRSSIPGTCRLSEAEARSGGGESLPALPHGEPPRRRVAVSASPRGSAE